MKNLLNKKVALKETKMQNGFDEFSNSNKHNSRLLGKKFSVNCEQNKSVTNLLHC